MMRFSIHIVLLISLTNLTFSQNLTEREIYFSALAEYRNNNPDKALQVLEQVNYNSIFTEFKARIYYEKGDFSSAIREYKKLSETNPAEAFYMLASIYAGMSYEKESLFYLDKHFQHPNPKSMAEINLNTDFDQITRSPEWREFWQESRYSKTREALDEAEYMINQDRNLAALRLLGNIRSNSMSDKQNYLTARVYYNMNDINSALHHLNLAINRNKRASDYYEMRLEIFEILKNDAQALEDIKSLVSLNPYNPDYLITKAKIDNNNNNYQAAADDLSLYLKYFPDNTEALYYSAVVHSNMHQFNDALILYNKLIELDCSRTRYFNGRADIYFYFEQWNFAILDYTMSLDINPRQPEVHYNLGWCRYKGNDKEKACNSWRHAARMGNRDAAIQIQEKCRD
jgi:tetratricopeptide (TPR) repeat protein